MSGRQKSVARDIAHELMSQHENFIPKKIVDARGQEIDIGCIRRHLNHNGWYLDEYRTGYYFNSEKLKQRKERLCDQPELVSMKEKIKKIPPVGEAGRIDRSLYKKDGVINPINEAQKLGYFIHHSVTKYGTEYKVFKEARLLKATYNITEALRVCGIDGYRK
jgi:hypothetical protein